MYFFATAAPNNAWGEFLPARTRWRDHGAAKRPVQVSVASYPGESKMGTGGKDARRQGQRHEAEAMAASLSPTLDVDQPSAVLAQCLTAH
ncbi:hypothetical protein JCM19000A_00910 [Silvimonas sp. JCM 19000]